MGYVLLPVNFGNVYTRQILGPNLSFHGILLLKERIVVSYVDSDVRHVFRLFGIMCGLFQKTWSDEHYFPMD